jgi:hypothetical protein
VLPTAVSLVFPGWGGVPACAAALAGLVLTVCSAILLEWLLRPARLDGPLPSESLLIAHLSALNGILKRSA